MINVNLTSVITSVVADFKMKTLITWHQKTAKQNFGPTVLFTGQNSHAPWLDK